MALKHLLFIIVMNSMLFMTLIIAITVAFKLKVAFPSWGSCHLGSCRFSFMGKLPLGKLSFGKMYIWEVAAWEIEHLGSCHLVKYPWEVAAWEKAFGKVPNIWVSKWLKRGLNLGGSRVVFEKDKSMGCSLDYHGVHSGIRVEVKGLNSG